jgi:hypothetical protein
MREYITANIAFPPLDKLDIGFHAFLGERASELVVYVSVRMQSSELTS